MKRYKIDWLEVISVLSIICYAVFLFTGIISLNTDNEVFTNIAILSIIVMIICVLIVIACVCIQSTRDNRDD